MPAVEMVSRDNDGIYAQAFDPVFKERGVRIRKLAIRASNTNAYVERFIQTLQVECLNHFLVFGEKHLDYLVRESSSTTTPSGRMDSLLASRHLPQLSRSPSERG